MPQPLSRVKPNADLSVGPLDLPGKELAKDVAAVIGCCSYLEATLGECLAHLIKSKPSLGVVIFQSLVSTTSKLAVLKGVISHVLTGYERDILLCLVQLASRAISRRNEIAHGLWGSSPDIPDALVLMSTSAHLDVEVRRLTSIKRKRFDKELFALYRSKMQIYKKQDFDNIFHDLLVAARQIEHFWSLKRAKSLLPGAMRSWISTSPHLQEELRRLREGRKKSASTPQQKRPPRPRAIA